MKAKQKAPISGGNGAENEGATLAAETSEANRLRPG